MHQNTIKLTLTKMNWFSMNIYSVEIWDKSCSVICTATLKYRQTN